MQYEFVFSSAVDSQTSVISDQIIRRIEEASIEKYPDELRMVVYEDFATGNVYRFITNHTGYEALTTAELYRGHTIYLTGGLLASGCLARIFLSCSTILGWVLAIFFVSSGSMS